MKSAVVATGIAYGVLSREQYLNRRVIVCYEAEAGVASVHGRSADLAFALAFALAARVEERGAGLAVAATGVLSDDGTILAVDGVAEKIAAALDLLPPQGMVFFPGVNEGGVSSNLRQLAEARRIGLFPVFRLEEAIKQVGFAITHTWLDCPFRGLEPFGFEHASIFFGRDKEIEDAVSLLGRRAKKGNPAVIVVGPSGSGKSSLVLAGVVPALLRRGLTGEPRPPTRWALVRLGAAVADADPKSEAASLGLALSAAWRHVNANTAPAGALDAGAFAAWLDAAAANPGGARYVWVLDQMEEWFKSPLQPETVKRLCLFFADLNRMGHWLIATLTSAGLPRLREHPELAAVFGVEGHYQLGPQNAASLEASIRAPAKAANLRFEQGLDTEIFAAASHGGADVLPLLELLLTELYERRDASRNELRFDDYRVVGGLEGVVAARADAAYSQCPEEAQGELPKLLWKLSAWNEVVPSDYPPQSPMQALIAAFQKKRLLVEDCSVRGSISLRAAHEALFRHWPRAVAQRESDEADIRLWLDLTREAGQWARKERALIPPGPQLNAAQSLCKRRASLWTAGDSRVLGYVRASIRQRTRHRVLARIALGVPAIAASVTGIGALAVYVESLHLTRIKFDNISVPGPDYFVAAAPYLERFGVAIRATSPDNAVVLIMNNVALYRGRAVDPASGQNILTQLVDPGTAPISYTLAFERPVKAMKLLRAALWAATESGVTHPAWSASALNANGRELVATGEPLIGSYDTVPAAWHVLQPSNGELVFGLHIESDFRDASGKPFAGFQAVLIQEMQLVH